MIRRQAAHSVHEQWPKLRAVSVSSSRRSTSVALTSWGRHLRLSEGGRAEEVNIVSSAMLVSFRRPIGELSLGAKIPSICQFRNMAEAGCIASYGITIDDIYVISADQIAKLLKGAKPADLPVQQPTKFKLVINLKTAAALGIMVPPTLIARAEEVIE
jgi:putative tryptophan/tyrosine transport system substrate-binding protein